MSRGRSERTRINAVVVGGILCAALLALACGGDVESRLAEVRAMQDVGQFTESLDELREILAIAPDLPEANYRLGVALVQTGEPSQAVWALKKAAESEAYAIVAGRVLASAQYDLGNYEEAVRAADSVLAIDPDRMIALQLRAQALLGAQRLDEALADTERLIELYPEDYGVRVLHTGILVDMGRIEEAKAANDLVKQMGADSGDPDLASRACLAPGYFAKDHLKDLDLARAAYEDCIAKYPGNAFVLSQSIKFYDQNGERDRSTALVREAVEQAPENLALRSRLASRLSAEGERDEAEAILVEAVDTFGSAAAWNSLASFYRGEGNHEKALEAIEKVIELSGGARDGLRFQHADTLMDAGEIDRAEEVAQSIKQPTYAKLILGRVALERGDPRKALGYFDEGIRHWPNNAGARFLAGAAAYALGDFDRAISEFREAVRADASGTDAALHLARIHYERGEYSQAASFANNFARQRRGPFTSAALALRIRSLVALEEFEHAESTLETMESGGVNAETLAERAAIARGRDGRSASVAVITGGDVDLTSEEGEPLLRALAEDLIQLERANDALARADRAIAKRPDAPTLHDLRGNILARSGRAGDAKASFEKALALDPESASAHAGLANLAAQSGDLELAVTRFLEAAALEPAFPAYRYSAAQLQIAQGLNDAAEATLREILKTAPGHAASRNDLAWLLAFNGGNLDEALALAQEARRLDGSAAILDTLGWIHLRKGDAGAAVTVLEEAVAAEPGSPTFRYHLGTALNKAGNHERAKEMLRTALEAGTFPEAEDARQQLAQIEKP